MQIGNVTTPFGRRPMSLGLMKSQIASKQITQGKSVDKWKVFRDACEARVLLGINDRALSVLNALLSFFPDKELSEGGGLIVFPSNNQLTLRAHGITGTTLRRHLAALVDAGLITRKDSPNGKRYAHKSRAGSIEDAFGFSLMPLLARANELAMLAQAVVDQRKALRLAKERLSICRRDIRKLLAVCIQENITGDWEATEARFTILLGKLPRAPDHHQIEQISQALEQLRQEIINQLETQLNSQETAAIDTQNDRHIQNSDTEYLIEPSQSAESDIATQLQTKTVHTPTETKIMPLGMVLKACPEISMYGPGGSISSWRDLITASVVVRSMLGVSSTAYQQACEAMGLENAAATMACILQRNEKINSAGGYLRDLTRRSKNGEFTIGPMLMALIRPQEQSSPQQASTPARQSLDRSIAVSSTLCVTRNADKRSDDPRRSTAWLTGQRSVARQW
jgi:replication initiation protein RepC